MDSVGYVIDFSMLGVAVALAIDGPVLSGPVLSGPLDF
jgi:hypothetical protein